MRIGFELNLEFPMEDDELNQEEELQRVTLEQKCESSCDPAKETEAPCQLVRCCSWYIVLFASSGISF